MVINRWTISLRGVERTAADLVCWCVDVVVGTPWWRRGDVLGWRSHYFLAKLFPLFPESSSHSLERRGLGTFEMCNRVVILFASGILIRPLQLWLSLLNLQLRLTIENGMPLESWLMRGSLLKYVHTVMPWLGIDCDMQQTFIFESLDMIDKWSPSRTALPRGVDFWKSNCTWPWQARIEHSVVNHTTFPPSLNTTRPPRMEGSFLLYCSH